MPELVENNTFRSELLHGMAGFVESHTFGNTLLHGVADLVESHPATPHTELDTKNKGWSIDHPLFLSQS